ncbi:hypothetical protein L596_024374 [Steinernema carpocapsae]|uniref:Uncharacterized protein n=1 Tax=Steinernema carpocapsae TaxID=34508 RepID=A0A4U5MGL2_STECR|nr:hypothetical protein L596_024374 [Steinernema carpocapsae]
MDYCHRRLFELSRDLVAVNQSSSLGAPSFRAYSSPIGQTFDYVVSAIVYRDIESLIHTPPFPTSAGDPKVAMREGRELAFSHSRVSRQREEESRRRMFELPENGKALRSTCLRAAKSKLAGKHIVWNLARFFEGSWSVAIAASGTCKR